MKKEILEKLKAKFEGVSDSILGRIAENLAKTATTEEEITTAVAGVTFQQVLDSYGDSRATEAQKTAVANYERKHNLKDGEKIDGGGDPEPKRNPGPDDNGGKDVPEWAKAIIDANRKLADRIEKLDTDRTTAARRQRLDEVVGKLPENLRKGYGRTSVAGISDEEFDGLLKEIAEEVEGIVKDTNAKGAVFGKPLSGGGKTNPFDREGKRATEEETKAVIGKINI